MTTDDDRKPSRSPRYKTVDARAASGQFTHEHCVARCNDADHQARIAAYADIIQHGGRIFEPGNGNME